MYSISYDKIVTSNWILILKRNIYAGPYKCHFDNPKHIGIRCRKDCTKLHPECNHPCNKSCGEKCGLYI